MRGARGEGVGLRSHGRHRLKVTTTITHGSSRFLLRTDHPWPALTVRSSEGQGPKDHGGEPSMKTLVAVAIALALVASGRVAEAYVAVVGTVISVPSAPDAERSARLEEAIWAAIRDVLEHAVAFTPTVVTIEDARIVGEYLSIFLSLRGASAGHRSVLPRGGGV